MYRSDVAILSYRLVRTLLGLVVGTHLISVPPSSRVSPRSVFTLFLSSFVLFSSLSYSTALTFSNNIRFPLPRVIPELPRPRTIPTSHYLATRVLQKRSLPSLSTTLYNLALPRSLFPPRKPWTECARHRVLVIRVVFSLVSFCPAYSFPSLSRHSSRVPCPCITFSLFFVLSPSAPIRCPTQPPDCPLGLHTLVLTLRPPSRQLRLFLIHPIT